MFVLKKQAGRARRGEFHTPALYKPVFMNVATAPRLKAPYPPRIKGN